MKNIAVMAWWDSSEFDVSLKSADNIVKSLLQIEEYKVFLIVCKWSIRTYKMEDGEEILVNKDDFSLTISWKRIFFDFVYIIIHWAPWENWKLQWYLDMMNVPYSTWWVLNMAIWFNKFASKLVLQYYGILSPKWLCVNKWEKYDESNIISRLWLPVFVKPNEWWSSFWITKVKVIWELKLAIDKAFGEGNSVIIEEAIDGREFTCWLFEENGVITVLPITEIQTEREFFDYEAKYLWDSKEITPADISQELGDLIKDTSCNIYRKLGCKWIVRIDYIYNAWKLYFIEINLTPWMTSSSLVPQQINACWLSLSQIIKNQIEQ